MPVRRSKRVSMSISVPTPNGMWGAPMATKRSLKPGTARPTLKTEGKAMFLPYTSSEPVPSGRIAHSALFVTEPLSTYSQRV